MVVWSSAAILRLGDRGSADTAAILDSVSAIKGVRGWMATAPESRGYSGVRTCDCEASTCTNRTHKHMHGHLAHNWGQVVAGSNPVSPTAVSPTDVRTGQGVSTLPGETFGPDDTSLTLARAGDGTPHPASSGRCGLGRRAVRVGVRLDRARCHESVTTHAKLAANRPERQRTIPNKNSKVRPYKGRESCTPANSPVQPCLSLGS